VPYNNKRKIDKEILSSEPNTSRGGGKVPFFSPRSLNSPNSPWKKEKVKFEKDFEKIEELPKDEGITR